MVHTLLHTVENTIPLTSFPALPTQEEELMLFFPGPENDEATFVTGLIMPLKPSPVFPPFFRLLSLYYNHTLKPVFWEEKQIHSILHLPASPPVTKQEGLLSKTIGKCLLHTASHSTVEEVSL